MDLGRDLDSTLFYGPIKYIQKMLSNYELLFKEVPKEYQSPLDRGDHPELDISPELDEDGKAMYLSMIGALQWAVSLGRYDIATAVMTMSRFRAAPRKGHLERLKRMYGYLRRFNKGSIRVRTETPNYANLPPYTHDWTYSVYGDVKEVIPDDLPTPLGKPVILTTYIDANLYHDFTTGRSVSGVLQLVNQTPIEWISKRQDTVETATYGSELVAARLATDKSIDLRLTLRYLRVPIIGPTIMFGDNMSVVISATVPHSTLAKRHNALSYHRVREAIAAGITRLYHIDGTTNLADILTKHLGYQQAWPLIKDMLFWRGPITVKEKSPVTA